MIQHRFPENEPLPIFLSGPEKKTGPSGMRKVVSSKIVKQAALLVAAFATVIAVVAVGNAILVASVTPSRANPPAALDASYQSAPAIQSTASAEAVPASQLGDELAAAIRSTGENRAEADRARAEALLNQFQTWAAKEDAQAAPAPQKPVQDVQADIVRSPPLPRRRPTQIAHTARSQDSSPQNVPSLMQLFGSRN